MLAHANTRRLRRVWINLSQPRGSEREPYRKYKAAKSIFRREERSASNNFFNKTFEELDKVTQLDINLFLETSQQAQGKRFA